MCTYILYIHIWISPCKGEIRRYTSTYTYIFMYIYVYMYIDVHICMYIYVHILQDDAGTLLFLQLGLASVVHKATSRSTLMPSKGMDRGLHLVAPA